MLSVYRFEYVWAAFLIRFALGMLYFTAGLGKFMAPGGTGAFRQSLDNMFANSWLPPFLYQQLGYVLPYAEVTLGVLLLVGLFRFPALLLGSLLMLVLAFGMMVLGKPDVVANNLIYLSLFAAALYTSLWDRLSVDNLYRRSRGGPDEDEGA